MFRNSFKSSAVVRLPGALVCLAALIAFALMTFAPGAAYAQLAGTGAISGTVQDPSGAVVANATVTATNVDTNVATKRVTTKAGDYNISSLIPGTYVITVTASGFETYKQENITVDALNTTAVNAKLSVGQASETVTVTSAPPLLQTEDATLGGVMDNQMYSNLPIQMGAGAKADQRRATDFASLMPGVQSNYSSNDPTSTSGIVNGSGPGGNVNDLYIDGVDLPVADGNGDPRGTWTALSVDAINQFQVQTAGISSQYAGQGMQNYSIKSGGNSIHGSLYEFNRNTLFDAWAFQNKVPTINGQGVTVPGGIKPREVQNEFGIDLSGPIIKNKLFLFANYGQYRYQLGAKPQAWSVPTSAMLALGTPNGVGDYTAYAVANGASGCNSVALEGTGGVASGKGCLDIYDPSTETVNCNGNTVKCARTVFHGMLNGIDQNDVIPASRISAASAYINQFWVPYEKLTNQSAYSNNLDYGTPIGLANWSQTARIDYNQSSRNQISIDVAFGRQASTGPNSTSGLGPPFNNSQSYHPVTALDVIKDTFTINPHLVNQFSFGYVRYQSVSVTPNDAPNYSASAIGLLGTLPGQSTSGYPAIAGLVQLQNTAYTEGGYSWNSKTSNTFTGTDQVQWEFGKHNFTFGGQFVTQEFNIYKQLSPTGPTSYTFSGSQTAGFPTTGGTAALSGTGNSVASYLIGAASAESIASIYMPGTGSREHDPSFWAQDDYKVSEKLTLNLGLRWDIYQPFYEPHNLWTFFNPNGTNSVTGNKGTLFFAGNGDPTQYCNCKSPIKTYYGNIAPRLGFAFSVDPKTVLRGSFNVNYARGGAEGGAQTGSPSTTGFTPSGTPPTQPTPLFPLIYWDATACANGTNAGVNCGINLAVTPPTPPTGGVSLAEYGTGNNSTTNSSGSSVAYWDPYKGSRTPQYENWTFGIQRQITHDISLTASYVGSQGHFIGGGFSPLNHRNALPSSVAALASYQVTGTTDAPCGGTSCTNPLITQKYSAANLALIQAAGLSPQNPYTAAGVTYTTANSAINYLTPYPQLNVGDSTNYNGNTNFHALEISLRGRQSHGVDFMLNYTYSKSMDDVGTFRTTDNPRLDRSLSTADQPQNLTATAVYASPFGKGHMASSNFLVRGLASGWIVSGIYTYHSGAPIVFVGTGCAGTPLGQCMPSIVPGVTNVHNVSYANPAGGIVAATGYANSYSSVHHFDPNAFTVLDYSNAAITTVNSCQLLGPGACANPGTGFVGGESASAYVPGNAPRVGALNTWGMGFYDVDLGLKRSFPVWENVSVQFEVDMLNATNHVVFGSPGSTVGSSMANVGANDSFTGSSTYGVISSVSNSPRDFQLSGRLNW